VPFWGTDHCVGTGDGARCIGTDGPRRGIGLRVSCLTVRAYRLDGPRVRRGGGSRRRCLDLAPGRDPVGEERS
jgi:hypothetical protein